MKGKIAIINDDPETLMLMGMLFKEMTSYETVVTNNPFEAVRLIEEGGIDAVIAEFKMPGQDGIDILRKTQSIDGDIPVIITSNCGTVETAVEAMRKGAFDFMVRPFRNERLLFAVNNALKFHELRKENKALAEQLNGEAVRLYGTQTK